MQVVIAECEHCGTSFDIEDNSELFEEGLCPTCFYNDDIRLADRE